MRNINSIKSLIGETPFICIKAKISGKIKNVYCKLEWFNFSGSIKDRAAVYILEKAIKSKKLKKGMQICEVTSGNMGISFASIGNALGFESIICIPKSASKERISLLKICGAKVLLTEDFESATLLSNEIEKSGVFMPRQFENSNNAKAYYFGLGREIALAGIKIESFVAGVGTGGTLMGVGRSLKKNLPPLALVAVEPFESRILSQKGNNGNHKIEGLSDGFVPKIYKKRLTDEVRAVKGNDAIAMSQKLFREFGLGVGISSGANFLAAIAGGETNVATVFPDDNKKYLSTELSKDVKSDLCDSVELISFKVVNISMKNSSYF
ncbi:MAG: cysteine synthase family protein [Clostridia bacterium]